MTERKRVREELLQADLDPDLDLDLGVAVGRDLDLGP